jgi:glycosyltransferase involved in cell wall biosynthesis
MITGLVALFCRRQGRAFFYGAGSDVDLDARRVAIAGVRDRLLFRYGISRCSGLVVQNTRQLAAARPLGKPVQLIPNGIRPAASCDAESRRAIVWMGSLWTVKRPDRLLELARLLPDREFVVLGGDFASEPEYSARIRADAARLANVTMLGRRPHDEVNAVLSRAALLVNTSEVEGFPNAYLEAWNHGVPVVTFNDVDDLIRTAGLGRVVDTVEEMADAIRSVGDGERRRAMGDAGRRHIREHYSPERLGPRYVEFFASVARQRGAIE